MFHIPLHWTHEETVRQLLLEILVNQEREMAAIDNLTAAVSQLSTDVAALISKPAGTSDVQIQAVADQVTALDGQVKTALGQ